MGYQLWMSPETGYRRQGTRFSCLKSMFLENISIKEIFEPILCCKASDSASDAKFALDKRQFDTTCVIDHESKIIGYIEASALGEGDVGQYVQEIPSAKVIDEDTSLVHLVNLLEEVESKYVSSKGKVVGIITRADLNKPIPRVYLFGVISLVELHLNFWVNHFHPNESWLDALSDDRQKGVIDMHNKKRRNDQYLSFIDCAQLCDKKDLLAENEQFRALHDFSKNKFKQFMERLEALRNEIAHSQSTINIEWSKISSTINRADIFLSKSDFLIEDMAKTQAEERKSDLLVAVNVT